MKLKRVLALFMAMTMLICQVACGSDESDVKGEIKNEETNGSGETSETNDADEEEIVVSLGTSSGTVYESEFVGIGWTLPTDWAFMTEDEIAQVNASVIDTVDEDIASQLEEGSVFCDMYAYNLAGDTVNIQIEKLATTVAVLVDEDAYADISIEQLPDAFESSGFTIETLEKTTVTIAGKEHVGISVHLTVEGVSLYEEMALIKVGQYMCIITTASYDAGVIDTVFNNFYGLE